jgi:PAS domain S-box-containing protein
MTPQQTLEFAEDESILRGERRILELIATGSKLQDVLIALCRLIDEPPGLKSAVYLLDRQARNLVFSAGPDIPEAWIRATQSFPARPGNTACGAAISCRGPVIVEDVQTSPFFDSERRAAAHTSGITGAWSTPFFSADGHVLGTFALVSVGSWKALENQRRRVDRAAYLASIAVERNHNERDLRESEHRFSTAFYAGPACMSITRFADGRFLHVNDEFVSVFGYARNQVIGRTALQLNLWADATQRDAMLEAMQDHRIAHAFEAKARTASGAQLDMLFMAERIQILGEECVLGITCDISARKRTEEKLHESLAQMRTLTGRLMRAQDDERRRIAQMLHETTAQDLAALKMQLARLARTEPGLSAENQSALHEGVELAERTMTTIRTLSYVLHPPFLDEIGLLSALRWYVEGFVERSGIKVELDLPETLARLPQDVETAVFRVVQEALMNVHRHASSANASIRVRVDPCELRLAVEDCGRGMSPDVLAQLPAGGGAIGVGIVGMRERLHQLGGMLDIESGERGTIVRASVPVTLSQS